MLIVCFHCIKQYKKSKENLMSHIMGKSVLVKLLEYNLKSERLPFWKVFYLLKILGCFRAIDDLPSAHWNETEFRLNLWEKNSYFHNVSVTWMTV